MVWSEDLYLFRRGKNKFSEDRGNQFSFQVNILISSFLNLSPCGLTTALMLISLIDCALREVNVRGGQNSVASLNTNRGESSREAKQHVYINMLQSYIAQLPYACAGLERLRKPTVLKYGLHFRHVQYRPPVPQQLNI